MTDATDISRDSTIELDGLHVNVALDGEGSPPWEQDWTVYRYTVSVKDHANPEMYHTHAWGSRADYEEGKIEKEDIGWMVLDELLSAAYDPDEFFAMATEDEGGRQLAVQILALIETATAMLPALERNQEAIEAHR